MDSITISNWIPLVVTLISGGAMGAVITAIITNYRNRIQPIGHRMDSIPVLNHTLGESSLRAKITIDDGSGEFHFNNLFLINIQLQNKGNSDVKEFPFGVTLSQGDKAIFVEFNTPDRHHIVELTTPVKPNEPKSEIDFTVKPFNRKDLYSIKMYVVINETNKKPSEIKLSSPLPVKFTDLITVSELIIELLKSEPIGFGPINISLKNKN